MAMTFSHLQLEVEYDNKIISQCLLNAALTCKDFLDVALDALWEKLYSLVPLLKLLPTLQVEDENMKTYFVCANFQVHVILL